MDRLRAPGPVAPGARRGVAAALAIAIAVALAVAVAASACTIAFIDHDPLPSDDDPAADGGPPRPDAATRPDARGPDASAPDAAMAACGNGVVDSALGEDCDAGGGDHPTCDSDCTFALCGDGHVNAADGEDCEPGTPSCSAACRWVVAPQVPPMSGPESPIGTVIRSGVFSPDYEGWHAFDGGTLTHWLSETFVTPAWIGYQWHDGPRTIVSYAVHFANGKLTSRAPSAFTLQGWDGSAWVVVDQRSDQTGWLGAERRDFQVASPGSYGAYRLHVTDDNDERAGVVVVSIEQLDLIGSR